MAKNIIGKVLQFGSKGYGFIIDDKGNKYFVHQKNIYKKSRLRANDKVAFNAENSAKGLVALDVRPYNSKKKLPSKNNNSTIGLKIVLIISILLNIWLGYALFV